MLSDEEKKAIEFIKSELEDEKKARDDYQSLTGLYGNLEIEILLNLIEKQQKEIEELKQIKSKLDEKNIPIETLLAEFERLEDLEDDLTTVYLNGVYDGVKKVEDKIKAKTIEIDEVLKGQLIEKIRVYFEAQKEVLQSLLRKEE